MGLVWSTFFKPLSTFLTTTTINRSLQQQHQNNFLWIPRIKLVGAGWETRTLCNAAPHLLPNFTQNMIQPYFRNDRSNSSNEINLFLAYLPLGNSVSWEIVTLRYFFVVRLLNDISFILICLAHWLFRIFQNRLLYTRWVWAIATVHYLSSGALNLGNWIDIGAANMTSVLCHCPPVLVWS